MKYITSIIATFVFTAAMAFAADPAPAAAEQSATKPGCCLKAEKKGKTCEKPCCVAAAKEGKACEKCLHKKHKEKGEKGEKKVHKNKPQAEETKSEPAKTEAAEAAK